jgi:hypothetical protein
MMKDISQDHEVNRLVGPHSAVTKIDNFVDNSSRGQWKKLSSKSLQCHESISCDIVRDVVMSLDDKDHEGDERCKRREVHDIFEEN